MKTLRILLHQLLIIIAYKLVTGVFLIATNKLFTKGANSTVFWNSVTSIAFTVYPFEMEQCERGQTEMKTE